MTASRTLIGTTFLILFSNILAQQPASTPPAKPTDAITPEREVLPNPPIPPKEELERSFQESLSNVTLEGMWQMTGKGGLKDPAPLSEPKAEKYTIDSVKKLHPDLWVVSARIQFADKDVNIPVLVRVRWAGDTPVITLDDFSIPMIGTYSARVMIHNGFYSGVWYCNAKNYGGVMQGRIVKTPPATEKPVVTDQK